MSRKGRNLKQSKKPEHNEQNNTDKSASGNGKTVPSESAWTNGRKTSNALFPNAELVQTPMRDDEEELQRAIDASLKSYEAQNRGVAYSSERYMEDKGENFPDDNYWSNEAHKNLPSPEHEKVKKVPDTNNNSAMKKTIDTPVVEGPLGASAMARKSGTVQENVSKFERAIDNVDKPSLAPPVKPPIVDKFGRVGGRNEHHMFMGPGARRRESEYIEEQKKKGLLWTNDKIVQSEKVTNESNRTKYNKSSQNMTNGDTELKKPLKSLGSGTKSQCESIDRASNAEYKAANHERISSQRNDRVREVESNDGRAEKSRIDETQAVESSRNKSIQESPDDSAKKPESKVLHITDFNSRHNKLIEENNSPSTSRPEVIKLPSSIRQDTRRASDDEGACSQTRMKSSNHSPRTYDRPSGYQSSNQPEIPNPSDPVVRPEALYDRLAVFDPSLHRLLMQKKMSELSLSNQAATNSFQGMEENFIDYENHAGIIDGLGNAIDTFSTPEQQAPNYLQLSMNYGHVRNPPRHMPATEFLPGYHHRGIRNNYRPDENAGNFPNSQYPEEYTTTFMSRTDEFGNIVQVPVIIPLSAGYLPGPSNFQQLRNDYAHVSLDYERHSLMRNPNMTMNPQSHQAFLQPQGSFPPVLANQGRMLHSRLPFNPNHVGNFNYYSGNRQIRNRPQTMQVPRESRGTGRLQQHH